MPSSWSAIQVISYNGQPLTSDGFVRVVVPGDQAMDRFVSNLVELQVVAIASM